MRCNRRIVTNGAYRRFRRFVRWFKNSGAGARCVTNNKRKMGGQNTLRPVQLRVWRAKIVILLRIAIQQVSLFEKLLAVCYGGCFIAQR